MNIRRFLSLLVSTFLTLFLLAGSVQANAVHHERWQSYHFGTLVSVRLYTQSPEEGKRIHEALEDFFSKEESIFSMHNDSWLYRLNQRNTRKMAVPPELASVIEKSLKIAKETQGYFDPTIGPLVKLWNIGTGGHAVPKASEISAMKTRVGYQKVKLTKIGENFEIELGHRQELDLGGIAKGHIGSKAIKMLSFQGVQSALIDLGGNVVTLGAKPDGTPWVLGLQDPSQARGYYFATMQTKNESVITSGAYERFIEKDGQCYGHILDVKTGMPSMTDISSITIIDQDGAAADAWCTALFSMGWKKAQQYLEAQPFKAIILHSDQRSVWLHNIEKRSIHLEPGFQFAN